MATATKARPVHEIRMGAVKCAIWANEKASLFFCRFGEGRFTLVSIAIL